MSTSAPIKIFATSVGNHFMLEIAQIFYEGFKHHREVVLAVDEVPNYTDDGVMQIIIAPHEFYPLFLHERCLPQRIHEITRHSYLLNVEQPGSPWFEFACEHCQYAKGVFDINQQGVDEFTRRGVTALLAPLGYAPCLESTTYTPDSGDKNELLFLGHISPKRLDFLSKNADIFHQYQCQFILSFVDKPRLADTPGFYGDEARNKLVADSQILINIHSSQRKYFEWHRALIAIANKCLLISEPSEGFAPLVNGEHIIITEIDKIAETCEYYLSHPQERGEKVNGAYEFVKTNLSSHKICLELLEKLNKNPFIKNPITTSLVTSDAGNDSSRELQSITAKAIAKIYQKLTKKLEKLPAQLSKIPLSKPEIKAFLQTTRNKIFGKDNYSFLTHLIWRYKHAYFDLQDFRQPRRTALITRLELVQMLEVMERPAYTVIKNNAYTNETQPSVSVIISLFNYAQYIRECLNSLIAADISQIPGGIEIIIVDDCSTDNSREIVAELMQSCSLPMQLVEKKFNTGLADVRNVGLKLAAAPYVFILDADNWIYPQCLNQLYQSINKDNYAASYGMINQFENTTRQGVGLISFLDWDENLLTRTPYIDAMAMLNKEILLKVGGYSTELIQYGWFGWEDYDLWLKLAQAGYKCKLVPQILSGYRVHGSSMIFTTERYTYQIAKHFRAKFASLIQSQGYLDRIFGFERRFLN